MILLSMIVLSFISGFLISFKISGEVNIYSFLLSILIFIIVVLVLFVYGIIYADRHEGDYKSESGRKLLIFYLKVVANAFGIIKEVKYQTDIPKDKPFVLISNHQSFLDIVLIFTILKDTKIGAIAKIELANLIFFKQWFKQARIVAMDRSNPRSSVASIMKGAKQVKEGQPMLIFPEGTRTDAKDGSLLEFKAGAFNLATKAEADIYLVCIHNLYKKNTILIPRKVKVTFLKPLKYEDYKELSTIQIAEICQGRIAKSLEEGF